MDRIGPAGGSPTTALTDGQQGFVDENLSSGQEGTNVPALFLNALMEEIMFVLAAAGIAPNINNWTQLLAAIIAIIAQQFGGFYDTATGFFYFIVPMVSGPPLIVQGGPATLGQGVPSVQVLLPTSFGTSCRGGLVTDNYLAAYQYGCTPIGSLNHVQINCPLQQLIGGTVQTRMGTANCYFICWGF